MSEVRVERYYPHPPRKVWRAMTRPRAVARWLAPGDFRARRGHRFTLTTPPAPGFDGQVRCEVLELEPPRRLVLSWDGGPIRSTVRFELRPEGDGTRLSLVHEGLDEHTDLTAVPVVIGLWEDRLAGLSLELGGAGIGAAVATVAGGALVGAVGVWLAVGVSFGTGAIPVPASEPTELADRTQAPVPRAGDRQVVGLDPDRQMAPPPAQATGRAHFYETAMPTTLNPLFARTMVDRRAQELVFDRLFFRSAITSELRSRLVTRFELSDGDTRLRVDLRDDVVWHDLRPFGPDDVCFTVDALLDPGTPSPMAKPYRDALVGCEVVPGESAAVITLSYGLHEPRERVAFPILPAHVFESTAVPPDHPFSTRPVGTGPMQAVMGRREVRYVAFDNPHHAPNLAELSQSEGGDPFVQVRTLLNAGIDGVITVPPALRADIAGASDTVLKSYDLRSWWYIAVNPRTPALADGRVRRALDHTLDRDALLSLTVGTDARWPIGVAEPVSGPFVPSSPYYNRSVPVPEHDLDEAARLMTEAGAGQQAGRWTWNGEPITLRIGMDATLDVEARDLLQQVANQLEAGGFEPKVYKIAHDDWTLLGTTGRLASHYDLLIGRWAFGTVDDVSDLFHTRTGGRGQRNLFQFSDPRVDALLERHRSATTDTTAQDAYHELHALLAEELPYLFLWKLDTKSGWRLRVRNNTIAPYHYFTEVDGWRVDRPR